MVDKNKFMLIDKIYKDFKKATNMSFSELKKWKSDKRSLLASESRAPINRNLRLLNTPKSKWTLREVRSAIKTINFIKRMRRVKRGKEVVKGFSRRDIALMNWGFNPKKKK